MTYRQYQTELRKRHEFPYVWGKKQTDDFDRQTDFIYQIFAYQEVINKIRAVFADKEDKQAYFNYALNRWYNFWSAVALEKVFCSMPHVKPHKNSKDRLVDFTLRGIAFDHKTSVFPKGFQKSLLYAKNNKQELIEWLYANQSQQQRKHHKNRLFVVMHRSDGQHWRLKSEIVFVKNLIENYVINFQQQNLVRLSFGENTVLSDVIIVEG